MDRELRRQARMAMRGVPERLGLRFMQGGIEMRARPNGTAAGSSFEWRGYATVYDTPFDMWDQNGEPYTESVAQGACKRTLANPNLDVPFLIGHNDAGIPMARTKSGTMHLSEDSRGLHVHVPAMDGRREEVRALASAVERGDLDEMSLAFVCLTPPEQQWDADFEHRTIREMDLHRGDVCAVTHGANPATAGAWMGAVEQLSFRRPVAIGGPALLERRADMSTADINDLPDSDFAYIEPGGSKDSEGKTTPRSLRHFPVNDAAHVRNALARAPQSPFGDKAMPAIKAAAKKFGVDVAAEHAASRPVELRASAADDANLAAAPDYDANAASHDMPQMCPECSTQNDLDANYCDHCGAGLSANVMVDDTTGIPGEETQFSADDARREQLRQQLSRLLELEGLAS